MTLIVEKPVFFRSIHFYDLAFSLLPGTASTDAGGGSPPPLDMSVSPFSPQRALWAGADRKTVPPIQFILVTGRATMFSVAESVCAAFSVAVSVCSSLSVAEAQIWM